MKSLNRFLVSSPGNIMVQLIGTPSNTVDFFVDASGAIGVSPGSLSFSYVMGGTLPPAQTITVTTLDGASGFSAVASGVADGITWLSVNQSSGTIPGSISVSVSPIGLPVGGYNGTVTLTGIGVGSSVIIPVTLTVTGPPTVVPSTSSLAFAATLGSSVTQAFSVTSSDGTTVFPYSVSPATNKGGNWLSVSPASGTTPGSFNVTAAAGSLAASTYTGTLTLNATGNIGSQVIIPVTFTVTGNTGGPTLNAISPASVPVGSPPFLLGLLGSGFSAGNLVTIGGTSFSAVFVSANLLTVTVPSSFLTVAQTLNVSVSGSNSLPFAIGGAGSNPLTIACSPASVSILPGAAYSLTCYAIGGTPPYNWTHTTLPAGLSVTSSTTGAFVTISGTPTLQGAQTFTVSATDSEAKPIVTTANVTVTVQVPAGDILVSGQVTASGVGLGGVTITVNGSQAASTTTNSSGNYYLALPQGGNYTLSAALAGDSFTGPVNLSNISTNQTVNFTGIAVTGLDFYPLTPCRIADTRAAAGFSGPFGPPSMAGGTTRTFVLPASACGVPATATAYSLNFTVVPPAGGPAANLTTWPTGLATGMPNVSTLNYAGSVVANAAIVPAGTNGAINVFVNDPTDVLFDINGYFAPPLSNGLEFVPIPPCRIADTRTGAGFSGQFGPPSLSGGATRTYNLPSSSCGIPATAAAYSLNFTVVPPAGGPAANLTTWPASQPVMPNVSTLNFSSSVVANAAIVPAGNGSIDVFVNDPTNLLFDTNGYFTSGNAGMHFYPVTLCRVADTRAAALFTGQFGPPTMPGGTTRTFVIPASACGIPATAAAYSLNFTVVPPSGGPAANLTTWSAGSAMPNVSTLNYYGGVVANAAIVPAGTNGAINVFVNFPSDVLFDINGYFAP